MSEEPVPPQNPAPPPPTNWQYTPSDSSDAPLPDSSSPQTPKRPTSEETITWTASEYVMRHKGATWYGVAMLVVIIVVSLTYLLTHDIISSVALGVAGIIFCLAAARKPHVLTYILDKDGITFGQHFHPYVEFQSFSVVREGDFARVQLAPSKRFMLLSSLYFTPEDEDRIVEKLSRNIPYQEHAETYADRLVRYIHL